ncbi:hypothetical protein BDV96DRAFT_652776 [Lophiotrema nucula]|uniref:Uncharacterized protein n=1 Tax=Lophiotrema nucula TaxID=690887 RepID=A0A6A5YN27_9PLEO|nr:hypothetical protein BDV96DRAFT_652776 [Lophiotrema nucula]
MSISPKDSNWLFTYEASATCPDALFSEEYIFDFDVLTDDLAASTWSLIDSAVPTSNNTLLGEVTVDRGNESQSSDIEVHIVVRSNNETGVAAVNFRKEKRYSPHGLSRFKFGLA